MISCAESVGRSLSYVWSWNVDSSNTVSISPVDASRLNAVISQLGTNSSVLYLPYDSMNAAGWAVGAVLQFKVNVSDFTRRNASATWVVTVVSDLAVSIETFPASVIKHPRDRNLSLTAVAYVPRCSGDDASAATVSTTWRQVLNVTEAPTWVHSQLGALLSVPSLSVDLGVGVTQSSTVLLSSSSVWASVNANGQPPLVYLFEATAVATSSNWNFTLTASTYVTVFLVPAPLVASVSVQNMPSGQVYVPYNFDAPITLSFVTSNPNDATSQLYVQYACFSQAASSTNTAWPAFVRNDTHCRGGFDSILSCATFLDESWYQCSGAMSTTASSGDFATQSLPAGDYVIAVGVNCMESQWSTCPGPSFTLIKLNVVSPLRMGVAAWVTFASASQAKAPQGRVDDIFGVAGLNQVSRDENTFVKLSLEWSGSLGTNIGIEWSCRVCGSLSLTESPMSTNSTGSENLFLSTDAMQAGAVYTLTARVYDYLSPYGQGETNVSFVVPRPPSGGICQATSFEGGFVNVYCHGWLVATELDLPLTYSYGLMLYALNDTNSNFVVGSLVSTSDGPSLSSMYSLSAPVRGMFGVWVRVSTAAKARVMVFAGNVTMRTAFVAATVTPVSLQARLSASGTSLTITFAQKIDINACEYHDLASARVASICFIVMQYLTLSFLLLCLFVFLFVSLCVYVCVVCVICVFVCLMFGIFHCMRRS